MFRLSRWGGGFWGGLRKQVSDVEEKPFTSSLNIGPSHVKKGGGGGRSNASPPPLTTNLIPNLIRNWSPYLIF